MESRKPRYILRALAIASVAIFSISAVAQEDPDPNSPTPELINETATARIFTAPDGRPDRAAVQTRPAQADGTITLVARNIVLAEGEGIDAFRFYGIDRNGREYRFPIVAMAQISRVR